MKSSLILLTIGALAGASATYAQSITVEQPPVTLAKSTPYTATVASRNPAMKHELSLNWARVTASRDARGKLVAQCTVEPDPIFAAVRKRAATNTTRQREQ